jgi:hypothetical protein
MRIANAKDAKDGKDGLRRENSMGMIHPSWGMVGWQECGKVFLTNVAYVADLA